MNMKPGQSFEQPSSTLPKKENSANLDSILNNAEKQQKLLSMLSDVYKHRPDIRSFVGLKSKNPKRPDEYSSDKISEDEKYVSDIQLEIEKANVYDTRGDEQEMALKRKTFEQGELLQAMVVDRLNKHWFKDCKAIMTSIFDDLRVGIDAVMKHKNGGYLGASFDFTVGNDDKGVIKKLNKQWERTTKGQVATIKYFEDPDTGEKGSLLVPRFIIAASDRDVEELAEAYLTNDTEALENHPFKYIMLKQIEEQLQTALDFFESDPNVERNSFAKKKYGEIQGLLRILKSEVAADEKMSSLELFNRLDNNRAYKAMRLFRVQKDADRKTSVTTDITTAA